MKKNELLKTVAIFIICGVVMLGGVSLLTNGETNGEINNAMPMIIILWLLLSIILTMFVQKKI